MHLDLSSYKALIFDMDGTLVDSMPVHLAAWQLALEQQCLPVDLDFVGQRGGMPTGKIAELYQQHFSLEIDIPQLVAAKKASFDKLWHKVAVIDVSLDIVKQAHGEKMLAIGTGADKSNMQRILDNLNLTQYFSVFIAADDVAAHKPEPDTFLKAAEQLGVSPQQCLVFEDTPFGLQAAHAAGMDCALIDKTGQLSDFLPVIEK